MEHEVNVLVLNHGKFGEELIRSAELIVGKTEYAQAVSLVQGMSIEEFYEEVKGIMKTKHGTYIILTDLFGGTPCNVAMMLLREFQAHVICGVNLPMLLELIISINNGETRIPHLLKKALGAGKEAIFQPEQIQVNEEVLEG